jgi:hypothetical protein
MPWGNPRKSQPIIQRNKLRILSKEDEAKLHTDLCIQKAVADIWPGSSITFEKKFGFTSYRGSLSNPTLRNENKKFSQTIKIKIKKSNGGVLKYSTLGSFSNKKILPTSLMNDFRQRRHSQLAEDKKLTNLLGKTRSIPKMVFTIEKLNKNIDATKRLSSAINIARLDQIDREYLKIAPQFLSLYKQI